MEGAYTLQHVCRCERRGVSRSASGLVLRPDDQLRFPCMSAEPCRNLVTIVLTYTGRSTTPTTPGLAISGQHRPCLPSARINTMSCASRRLRGLPALPANASQLSLQPSLSAPQGAQHVPGGNITTCCCSEPSVLAHDWVGQSMLALYVSATRLGPRPSTPSQRAGGWAGREGDSARLSHEAPQSIPARHARALSRGVHEL